MEHLTSEKKIPLVLPGEEAYLILARETISKHLNSGLQQHGMRKVHQKKLICLHYPKPSVLNTLCINKKGMMF